jgi:hypothetical protein
MQGLDILTPFSGGYLFLKDLSLFREVSVCEFSFEAFFGSLSA